MASPSPLSQYALYIASALSAATVLGHTQMGFQVVLPSLRRLVGGGAGAGKKEDEGIIAARIGWWEVNQVLGVMAILYAKWAKYGVTDNYDRSILLLGTSYQFLCGLAYARKGMYQPVLPLCVGPALAALSQLL